MRAASMIVGLIVAIATGIVSQASPTNDNSKKILGVWQLTKGTIGGAPLPEAAIKAIKLELSESKYLVTGAESPDEGTWEIHSATKPAGIDVHGVNGPNAGKTFLAIYALKGDTLKVCYDLSGKTRPKRFESEPRTMTFLAEYHRIK